MTEDRAFRPVGTARAAVPGSRGAGRHYWQSELPVRLVLGAAAGWRAL